MARWGDIPAEQILHPHLVRVFLNFYLQEEIIYV